MSVGTATSTRPARVRRQATHAQAPKDPPHADSCGGYSTSYGASVGVCFSGSGSTSGYISWAINTSGSRTDERMYFTLHSNCRSWTWSVNDYQGPDSSSASAYCSSGGFWASSYSTESGNRSGGPIELF